MKLWTLTLASAVAAACAWGCTGSADLEGALNMGGEEQPPPPPPPPEKAPDGDGDSVADDKDKCPEENEDGKGPDPNDGCPSTDPDGDGVAGDADQCPDEPETVNKYKDDDGCPDKPLAELQDGNIVINQKILFKKGSAEIEADSDPLLDAVAKIMKEHEELTLIELAGHASVEGTAFTNQQLTQKRVDAVAKALAGKGIDEKRLLAQGYGSSCPKVEMPKETTDPAEQEKIHEQNRRVEFYGLLLDGKRTPHERGCEKFNKWQLKSTPELKAAEKAAKAEGS